MPITHFDVEFTKDGLAFNAAQGDAIVRSAFGFTDLILISHGWNNNIDDARNLYDQFFESVTAVMTAAPIAALAGREFGVARVFWPSKKFESSELIPAGGAASADLPTQGDAAILLNLLERLKVDPQRLGGNEPDPARVIALDEAKALVPRLEGDPAARKKFVMLLRSILDRSQVDRDDASDEFFENEPEQMFDAMKDPVIAPVGPSSGGGVGLDDRKNSADLGDLFSGAVSSARRIANYATYYQMKDRAGTVGRLGVLDLLNAARAANPAIRLHLVGHSFGGRLVTVAAHGLAANTASASLTLLQAAFSHNGLSPNFDGEHRGAFREILSESRISGPIAITHTKNDEAVGIAYPLASRLAHQQASALGDENDPYGGMGRNGAQHTGEVDTSTTTLTDVGIPYTFAPEKFTTSWPTLLSKTIATSRAMRSRLHLLM